MTSTAPNCSCNSKDPGHFALRQPLTFPNSPSRFANLPTEIRILIYKFAHTFTERERARNCLKTLMLLNRRSADLVRNTPSLWTVVTVKMWKDSTTPERIASLRAYLKKGGNLPLDVIVVGNNPQKETQDLVFGLTDPDDAKVPGNGPRIRSLTFPSSEKSKPGKIVTDDYVFPNLQVVHLSHINNGLWSAPKFRSPNLQILIQPSGRLNYGKSDHIDAVHPLKVLDLRHPSGLPGCLGGDIEFRQLYKLKATLEELSFAPRVKGRNYVRCPSHGSEPEIPPPYMMERIRLLRLDGLSTEAVQFLREVAMPELHHLCILEAQQHKYKKIEFTRNFEALRILDWKQWRNRGLQEALKTILLVAPNLEEVNFSPPPHKESRTTPPEEAVLDEELQLFLMNTGKDNVVFAPHLKVLRIKEASIKAVHELITIRPRLKVFVNILHAEELEMAMLMPNIVDNVEIVAY